MIKSLLPAALALSLSAPAVMAETKVKMQTNMGDIVLSLDEEQAPETVANFLRYTEDGFYDGTIFHRIIDGFMIQGGGFTENMERKATRDPIENEAKNGLKNEPGSIAMARTSAPHSATAQFFINVNSNKFLDYPGQDGWGYTVFGKVIEGMDTVEKIRQVETGNKGRYQDLPVTPVVIEKVTIVE